MKGYKIGFVANIKHAAAKIHCAQILNSVKIASHSRILEIGCESGYLSNLLRASSNQVIGIDINIDALQMIKSDPSLAADATHLPFSEGAFDIVICCHSLEHVPAINQVLAEINRVLSRQGNLVVIYPYEIIRGITLIGNINTWPKFWAAHRQRWTPRILNRITTRFGFTEKSSHMYYGLNQMFITVLQKTI